MGNYGARPGPGGSTSRRARFSRAAAAVAAVVAVVEEEEDVGHARAGGGAGSERAARRPDAAAGRLRRCGGAGGRAVGPGFARRGRPGGGAEHDGTAERPELEREGAAAGPSGVRPRTGRRQPRKQFLGLGNWSDKKVGTRSCRKLGLTLR